MNSGSSVLTRSLIDLPKEIPMADHSINGKTVGRHLRETVRRRHRCSRQARHRHQHSGQGAQEADGLNHRSRIRQGDGDQLQDGLLLLKEEGKNLNDNGKICTVVTSPLGAFTPFYAAYAGTQTPVEHHTRAASEELGARGIPVTAVRPGATNTPLFYPAGGADAVAYQKTAAALSGSSKTGLTESRTWCPSSVIW